MTHKLGFLLMGAPRSGTTAVTEAINCHPVIFCGMEVFHARDCHENISFPNSYNKQLLRISGERRRSLQRLLDAKRHTASVIGNKDPRYEFVLNALIRRFSHLKLIFMYRNPLEFVSSWNRRAADASDESWHPGQRGIFGFLSLYGYLRGLQRIDTDCLVTPYDAFSADVAGVTTQMIRHLGVHDSVSLASSPTIKRLQRRADKLKRHTRGVLDNEGQFFCAVRLAELDDIFRRDGTFSFAEIGTKAQDYLLSLRGQWGTQFIESLVAYEDPNAVLYFRKMLRQPAIAEIFAEEAVHSNTLRQYLRALPRRLKFRRMFMRGDDLKPFEHYIRRVQNTRAVSATS